MAGSGVTLYATTAAGNKAVIGTIDWREDVYMPSQINDNIGQIMADIRAMANAVATGWIEIGDGDGTYTATYVSATSFRFDGVNVASYYRAGMRVRVVAPTPGTLDGTITSSVFSTHTTLVVAWDSGQLSNEAITSVSLGIGSGGASGAQPSYRNILGRNGGCEVWQRGAGDAPAAISVAASSGDYTCDGWFCAAGANQAASVQQSSPLSDLSRWAMLTMRLPGQTGTGAMSNEYPLDTNEIVPMRGAIVTLSFLAIAGANWSPLSGNLSAYLITGTAAPARFSAGFTGAAFAISGTAALTTATRRFAFTSAAIVPIAATQASVFFQWTPVGTAGAADWFSVDDVQLEIGSGASPFERRPLDHELLACKRHFYKTFPYGTAPAQNAGATTDAFTFTQATGASAGHYGTSLRLPVSMRSAPAVTLYNPSAANANIRNNVTSTDWASSSSYGSTSGVTVYGTTPVGSAAGHDTIVHFKADAGI